MADNKTSIIISAIDATKAGLDSVRNNLSGIQTAAAAVGLSLSAMGAVAGLVAVVKHSIDAADKLNDLSQSLGLSIQQLAAYKLAAAQSGTSLESVGKGIKGLSSVMSEHGAELKAAGITAKDADGAMRQLADLFKSMPDGIEKTALATKLFGRSGMDLIPMLNMGSKGLDEAAEKSAKYAAAMSAIAPQADQVNDNMAELSMHGEVLGVTIASQVLPGLVSITAAMGEAAKEGGLLMAAWVGVGGVMSQIFTDNDLSRAQQITKELERLRGLMADNIKYGTGFGLFSMGEQTKQEVNNISAKMLRLQQELADIQAAADKALDAAKPEARDKAAMDALEARIKKIKEALGIGKESVSEYAKLQRASDNYVKSLEKEIAQSGLDVTQKKMVEASLVALTLKTDKERMAVMQSALAWADATRVEGEAKAAKDALTKATEEALTKATEEALKTQQEYMGGIGKETEALIEKALAAEEENARIGLTAVQLAKLTVNRYDEQIALKMAEAATLKAMGGREAEVFLIEQQIEALRRLAGAAAAKPALEAGAAAITKQADDWKNFTRDIEGSLTDALMNGFKNGESFGKNFFDTLEATAKTPILKFGVQLITNPIMGGINSVAQGGSFMQGASGLANIGSAFTTGGALTSAAGGYGAFAGSSIGASLGLSEMAVIPGSAGMAAGSTLTTLGTAMPYIAAAVMAYSLLNRSHGTPTSGTGNASMRFDSSGQRTGYETYAPFTNAASGGNPDYSNTATDAFVSGMQKSYTDIAKSLGIGLVDTWFSYGGNTGKDGKAPNFALGAAAGGSRFYQDETALSDAAVSEAASRAVFAALQGSELPGYLKSVFDGLDASKMSGQDISATLNFAGALKQVRSALTETRTPFEILEDNLKTGTAALHTTAKTFKQDFVKAIDEGITPEKLAEWTALGIAIDQVTAATAEATASINGYMSGNLMSDFSASTASLFDKWKSGTNTIYGLTSAYDGSIAAQQTLGAALQTQYQTELQLIGQIQSALSSTQAMFGNTAETITLSTMTPQQQYAYYQSQISSTTGLLNAATDPAIISSLAATLNGYITSAWNLLTPEQKTGAQSGFLDQLDPNKPGSVASLVNAKLTGAGDAVTSGHTGISTAITAAMDPLIIEIKAMYTQMTAAAAKIDGAGDKINTAADKPAVAQVHVSVSAPEGSEVFVQ